MVNEDDSIKTAFVNSSDSLAKFLFILVSINSRVSFTQPHYTTTQGPYIATVHINL